MIRYVSSSRAMLRASGIPLAAERPSAMSVGQADAALGAAAGQNLAAISGSHALAEAMLLGTLALLGLIGTKHRGHLLI